MSYCINQLFNKKNKSTNVNHIFIESLAPAYSNLPKHRIHMDYNIFLVLFYNMCILIFTKFTMKDGLQRSLDSSTDPDHCRSEVPEPDKSKITFTES